MEKRNSTSNELVNSNSLEFEHFKLKSEVYQLERKVVKLEKKHEEAEKKNVELEKKNEELEGKFLKTKIDFELELSECKLLIENQSKNINDNNVKLVDLENQAKASKSAFTQMGSLFQTQAEQLSGVQQELTSLKSGLQENSTAIESNQIQPPGPSTSNENVQNLENQLEASKIAILQMGNMFTTQAQQINAIQSELNSLKSENQTASTAQPIQSQPFLEASESSFEVETREKGVEQNRTEKRKYVKTPSPEKSFATAAKAGKKNEPSTSQQHGNGNWNGESAAKTFKPLDLDCRDALGNNGSVQPKRMDQGLQLPQERTLTCSTWGCGMRFPNKKSFAEHIRNFHN